MQAKPRVHSVDTFTYSYKLDPPEEVGPTPKRFTTTSIKDYWLSNLLFYQNSFVFTRRSRNVRQPRSTLELPLTADNRSEFALLSELGGVDIYFT